MIFSPQLPDEVVVFNNSLLTVDLKSGSKVNIGTHTITLEKFFEGNYAIRGAGNTLYHVVSLWPEGLFSFLPHQIYKPVLYDNFIVNSRAAGDSRGSTRYSNETNYVV